MSILGQLQRRIGMQGEEAQWAKNGKNSEEKNVRTVTVDDMTHEYDNLLTKAFNST